jgi:CDP-glycerol glycerophosphotransferase
MPGSTAKHTPLISVVVPVHGVRQYLTACLDSLLGPPGAPAGPEGPRPAAGPEGPRPAAGPEGLSLEVIAVDDASTDGSGGLLDDRAAEDGRLTVVRLARTGGPGNARNTGLARATGAYVWFVDGDDFLPDGALPAVAARLLADRPDVLLIDHEERYPDGSTSPSQGEPVLGTAPDGTFTLADAPRLINLTMTAWSKLFLREFLIGLDEPFRSGIHEDIPVTCAALLAGRISALDQVCYSYRRSRPGSFMATTSSAHWGVFSAYDEVLEKVRKLADSGDPVATPAVQRAVFERAIWHYSTVFQATAPGAGRAGRTGSRRTALVPRRERRRFFERMHADFLRYRPLGYQLPAGARGAKFRLIERGAFRTYVLLEPVNRMRVAARRRLARDGSGERATGSA